MKTEILKAIESNKEIQKGIKKLSHFSNEDFYNNAERYINAVRENRVICSIGSVSRSGMSRTMKFMECSMGENRANWYNFHALFLALGFSVSRSQNDYFTISGCGMDMVFHTNYTIIHQLGRLGFLTKEEIAVLAQNTPPVI